MPISAKLGPALPWIASALGMPAIELLDARAPTALAIGEGLQVTLSIPNQGIRMEKRGAQA